MHGHRAAVRGQEDCVELLLPLRDADAAASSAAPTSSSAADVRWRDNGGLTPFHAAAAAGQISVLGLLLESLDDGRDVQNMLDNDGYAVRFC